MCWNVFLNSLSILCLRIKETSKQQTKPPTQFHFQGSTCTLPPNIELETLLPKYSLFSFFFGPTNTQSFLFFLSLNLNKKLRNPSWLSSPRFLCFFLCFFPPSSSSIIQFYATMVSVCYKVFCFMLLARLFSLHFTCEETIANAS